MDYICIEIYESDDFKDYFEIDPIIFTYKKCNLENSEIFIFQYSEGNELCFSSGKIKKIEDNNICHRASTKEG